MNYPKAYLEVGKTTLIENIIDTYHSFTKNIFVVLNHEFAGNQWQRQIKRLKKKAHIILNTHPEKGRFYSIRLGISQIKDSDFCFIHNVDNPVTPATIRSLFAYKNEVGYTVPSYENRNGHPILISRKVMNGIANEMNDNLNWRDFLSSYHKRVIDTPDSLVLINLNTKEEYEHYIQVNE